MIKKIETTLNQRGNVYGTMEKNAEITQGLMRVIAKSPNARNLSAMHVETLHMIFHKISRMVCGDPMYLDNVHDIIGYAKLLEDYINAFPTRVDA